MALMADIAAQYRNLRAQVCAAAKKVGREPGRIRLLAASKSQPSESIRAALNAGVTLIGENYVQEADDKKRTIFQPAEWHMIGHLQRNKVKAAVELFDLIETLDSAALARALEKEGEKRKKIVRTFVEVNLAGEKSKSGLAPDELGTLLKEIATLPHVRVEGLMTVPPVQKTSEDVRIYFRALRELREAFRGSQLPNVQLEELSMGMSEDFAVAVEEGATIVRIGTALFGPRTQ